jgi:transcriptional regulator with XRE-family HTH domain
MNETELIGAKLSELRNKKGLSQRALGELTGINHSNIFKIEKGKISASIETISRICDALNASLEIIEKVAD